MDGARAAQAPRLIVAFPTRRTEEWQEMASWAAGGHTRNWLGQPDSLRSAQRERVAGPKRAQTQAPCPTMATTGEGADWTADLAPRAGGENGVGIVTPTEAGRYIPIVGDDAAAALDRRRRARSGRVARSVFFRDADVNCLALPKIARF